MHIIFTGPNRVLERNNIYEFDILWDPDISPTFLVEKIIHFIHVIFELPSISADPL